MSQRWVQKVLWKWKPFFSHWIVLNSQKNRLARNRFAIVLWWKSVQNAVQRNYFRRLFYSIVQRSQLMDHTYLNQDYVFVVKKQSKLDARDEKSVANFKKDIHFLIKKTLTPPKK